MKARDHSGDTRPAVRFAGYLRQALAGLAVAALAGCGGNSESSFLVDPARYDAYHCNDLAARWKVLVTREKELRSLMDKAAEASGGAIIGSLSYRTDYDSVIGEEKLLQRTAAEKNCSFTAQFQSDQVIH